jgi:hypothetical protein
MHKHEGRQPSKNMSTLAYQSSDELTDMKPMQRGTSRSTNVRHALISTCEATGYRQVHGLVDLTQESLIGVDYCYARPPQWHRQRTAPSLLPTGPPYFGLNPKKPPQQKHFHQNTSTLKAKWWNYGRF